MTGSVRPGEYLTVNGHRLYVDVRGPETAPAVLFIHGGPGQGGYDFTNGQGDLLAQRVRVITPDQRGVLFSDPLPEGESLSEHDLVADFDAIRERLGIQHWTIIGHSFGGRLALRYGANYPDSVRQVIFENPTWDFPATLGNLLEAMLPVLRETADTDIVARAERLLASDRAGIEAWNEIRALLPLLGDRRTEVYDNHPVDLPSERLDGKLHEHTSRHIAALDASPSHMESLLPLLAKLNQPALLIKGRYDPATSSTEIERFGSDVRQGRIEFFERSGHFAQLEEAEKYTNLVTRFVLDQQAH